MEEQNNGNRKAQVLKLAEYHSEKVNSLYLAVFVITAQLVTGV